MRVANLNELPGNSPAEVETFRTDFNSRRRTEQLAFALNKQIAFPPPAAEQPQQDPIATIVITTCNRRNLLAKSIRAALAQSVPVEVIVMDDGSSDGTAEMLRRDFPYVQHHQVGTRRGPSFQRNRGIEIASTDLVFPIDDDSVFSSPYVVEQTIREFDSPRVAAVAIPHLNPSIDRTLNKAPASNGAFQVAHAFVGASHAIRRRVFLSMGGYREHLYYMGEEGDLCLRMLRAGYITRVGRADPIHHFESPARNNALASYYGRRNDVLFVWHNVPAIFALPHLFATTLNGLAAAVGRRPTSMLRGIVGGYVSCWRYRGERRAVPAPIYWLFRRLKKTGPLHMNEILHLLPELPALAGVHQAPRAPK